VCARLPPAGRRHQTLLEAMKGCTVSAISQLILADTAKKSNGSAAANLILLLGLGLLVVLVLRSRKKQKLRTEELRSSIEVGQRVMTSSGILATVVGSDDESYSLEVADGVVIKFVKRAVTKVLPPAHDPEYPGDETADTAPDQANVSYDG
jgi:preprotein translocase subunit YajC